MDENENKEETQEGKMEENIVPVTVDTTATGEKPPRKRNWVMLALIAVSVVAVLLLASTIALAVTGGYCHDREPERYEEYHGHHMDHAPMHWRDDEGDETLPDQPGNPDNWQRQPQPQQTPPPVVPPGQGL